MKEELIRLGAEVVSSISETAPDMKKITILTIICALFLAIFVTMHIWGAENANTTIQVTGEILGLLTIVIYLFALPFIPEIETGNTVFTITVQEDTQLTKIAEHFEIVDSTDYPVLVVKSKTADDEKMEGNS